jgi:hypothetical protein
VYLLVLLLDESVELPNAIVLHVLHHQGLDLLLGLLLLVHDVHDDASETLRLYVVSKNPQLTEMVRLALREVVADFHGGRILATVVVFLSEVKRDELTTIFCHFALSFGVKSAHGSGALLDMLRFE